jgi:hypothetical protein
VPACDTVLAIENGKMLQVSGRADDAIRPLDAPAGCFGTLLGSREKDWRLAKLLADAVQWNCRHLQQDHDLGLPVLLRN